MDDLAQVAPAFVAMAHRIVWCSVATIDGKGRPRTRILHPIWQWDGVSLVGWIATSPLSLKASHLAANPHVSLSYWEPSHDTCSAECRAAFAADAASRAMLWDLFLSAPAPVGYNPGIVPGWEGPDSPGFGALRLEPLRLRVFPGSVLMGQGGKVLRWKAA